MSIITQKEQLIGKVLIAAKRIPVKSGAWNNSPVKYHVEAGQPVGEIWSWLDPKEGRERLHFNFKDTYGYDYYVEYHPGWYNEVSLKDQIEASKPKPQASIADSLFSSVTGIGMKAIGAYVGVQILKALFLRK